MQPMKPLMNAPQVLAPLDDFKMDGEYIDPHTGVALSYRYATAHMAHYVASKTNDKFIFGVLLIVICVRVDGKEVEVNEVMNMEALLFSKLLNLINRERN